MSVRGLRARAVERAVPCDRDAPDTCPCARCSAQRYREQSVAWQADVLARACDLPAPLRDERADLYAAVAGAELARRDVGAELADPRAERPARLERAYARGGKSYALVVPVPAGRYYGARSPETADPEGAPDVTHGAPASLANVRAEVLAMRHERAAASAAERDRKRARNRATRARRGR